MTIGGFLPFSLSDFPGRPTSVVFTQGCNLRCPFCHNGALIGKKREAITVAEVLGSLAERRKLLKAVVVSGGEPCTHRALTGFCGALKELGLCVKLDTNGTYPQVLSRLLDARLIDYVAMDVKAPPDRYALLAGRPVDWRVIRESIDLIANSRIAHHFRTTVVTPLLSSSDLDQIRRLLPSCSAHILQEFRPELARDATLRKANFVLSTGCDLPQETPLENIEAFMRAGRRHRVPPAGKA